MLRISSSYLLDIEEHTIMVGRLGDELGEILADRQLGERKENWLRLFLSLPGQSGRPPYSGSSARADMVSYINSVAGLGDVVRAGIRLAMLPEDRFSWLTDNARQNKWVLNYLESLPVDGYGLAFNASSFLSGRHRIVALFDVFTPDGSVKEGWVNSVKLAWEIQAKKDKVFDWFLDEGGAAGRELMWAWLSKRGLGITATRWIVSNHDELLSFFDESTFDDLTIRLMMLEIKRAWSQKKYRASLKDKRQCNLLLRDKTIAQLDKLAKKHDLSRAELLELIINGEARQEVYINQRLEKRHALMH
jgi:hypothetical protein